MVLIVVPCNDAARGLAEKVGAAENVHMEQDNNSHADLCSPFCVCHCCGMSITVTVISKLLPEKIALAVKDNLPEKNYNYAILHPAGIWQPPKIG